MEKTDFNPENSRYLKAKERVEELKGFYSNLIAYCCIIPLLALINYLTYWNFQWFWFAAAGWGVGVVIHAFTVFGYGKNWEERKIKELMGKDNF
jgi:hypothetical protein